MVSRKGEERTGKPGLGFLHEVAEALVRIPQMAEHHEARGVIEQRSDVGRHLLQRKALGPHLDIIGRVIARRHDQVEARHAVVDGFCDKVEEVLVVHAPLMGGHAFAHVRRAVDLFRALIPGKVAEPLPAQVSSVEEPGPVAEPLERLEQRGRIGLQRRRLVIDLDMGIGKARDDRGQGLHGAVRGGEEAVERKPVSGKPRKIFRQPQGSVLREERPGIVALHDDQEDMARRHGLRTVGALFQIGVKAVEGLFRLEELLRGLFHVAVRQVRFQPRQAGLLPVVLRGEEQGEIGVDDRLVQEGVLRNGGILVNKSNLSQHGI